MKRNGLKRGFSGLLAVVMTLTMLLGLGIGEALFAAAEEPAGADIVWDFEDGKLEPFKLVSGSYGTIISNVPWQHNSPTTAYARQGDYHLTTLETTDYYTGPGTGVPAFPDPTKMTKPSDAYVCELHSPMFRLDDPKLSFLVGGGATGGYIALCNVYGQEIMTAAGNNDEIMRRVEWDVSDEELVGQYVFIKINDTGKGGWNHLTFDDFHAFGYVDPDLTIQPLPPKEIIWGFEDGVLAPFEVAEGTFGRYPIASWIYERNAPKGPINKAGDYYLATLENDGTLWGIDEAYTGSIVSPTFCIRNPKVTLKLGGGADPKNYVAICRAEDDEELVKYSLEKLPTYEYDANGNGTIDEDETSVGSGHMFTDVTLDLGSKYVEGEEVYLKIVDGTTSNWGFITVDDIHAYGEVVLSEKKPEFTAPVMEYTDIHWSFEDGTCAPFTTDITLPGKVSNLDNDKATGAPLAKDGTYWINSILTTPDATNNPDYDGKFYSDEAMGEFVSPYFYLDPAAPTISLVLNGGNKDVYAAVYDAVTDTELQRVTAPGTWPFKAFTLDLSGKVVEGQPVYMKLVDASTVAMGWFGADNIRFKGALADQEYENIQWGFEEGTIAPFTTTDTGWGQLINNMEYDYNTTVAYPNDSSKWVPLGKEGTYFLDTVMLGPNSFDDTITGSLTSPVFVLDPLDPTIRLKISGGPASYVAVYDAATDAELGRVENPGKNWPFVDTQINWKAGYTYRYGTQLYLRIVDNGAGHFEWLCVDDFRFKGKLVEKTYQDVQWGFEEGSIAPFTTTDVWDTGKGKAQLINSMDYDYNSYRYNLNDPSKWVLLGKEGKYFVDTVMTGPDSFDDTLTGSLKSPYFILDPENTTIKLKMSGGLGSYVAVYNAETDEELGRAANTVSEWPFKEYEIAWKDGYTYEENTVLYIKVVDEGTGGFEWLCVDDFRFKGEVMQQEDEYKAIHWSFEDGTHAPFTTTIDLGGMVSDLDNDKATGAALAKDGKYWINTILLTPDATNPPGMSVFYDDAAMGEYVSPSFYLDPTAPTISMVVNGGTGDTTYVAVCDASTGEIIQKINAPGTWPFKKITFDLSGKVNEEQMLYIKIVDASTVAMGWLGVDDIRFRGKFPDYVYSDVCWSFENGTLLPFTTKMTHGGVVSNMDNIPDTATPLEYHGEYFANTILLKPDGTVPEGNTLFYDDTMMGELVSPEFMLNPDAPTISFTMTGGIGSYVAVYNVATGAEIARATPTTQTWPFVKTTMDLSGKFTEGDLLVLKVVDASTVGMGWLGVDHFQMSAAFRESPLLTSEKAIAEVTGWPTSRFNKLIEVLEDLINTYGEEAAESKACLEEVLDMQAQQKRLAKKGIKKNAPELRLFADRMDALEYESITSNPLLTAGPMVITVHHQYLQDHHNTHNMFPSYNGEINSAYYTGGGAVKLIDFASEDDTVITLLEDSDGLYRDLEASYEADKLLLSYRQGPSHSYNIVEYTLNEDKTAISETKQLTSLSTSDDMDPLYLPSGQIVFGSTRDPKYVMCNRHIASNLYRMEADGANIVKITSSTLFERPTDIMPDGRILYDRWEYNDRDFGSAQGLWTVYTDGTKQDTYYGNNSPTGATIEAKIIPGTQKVIATLSSTHDVSWGALAIIDRSKGVDGRAPVERTWPASAINGIGDPNKAGNNIDAYVGMPIKYEDPQPLSDKYFLASRQIEGKGRKMGIYLLDVFGNETLIYEDATGMGAFDATILAPRAKEVATSDRRNYNDDVGSFFVQDVYEGTHMQGIERGTVKTLRIVESLDKKYISQHRQWGGEGQQNPGVNWHSFEVKRVIGEVPVYEDGSAYFEVPQDVFVYFQLLDESGRMIQSMRSGTLVQSGEKTGCIGCHEDRRYAPILETGTVTPMALEANVKVVPNPDYVEGGTAPETIAVNTPDVPQKRILDFATGTDKLVDWDDPELFPEYTDLPTMNFLTEVQPVFTNNCLECHGYDKKEANLSLVPDKDVIFNAAYINLWVQRGKPSATPWNNLVGVVGGGDARFYSAKQWGSHNSALIKKIYEDANHKDILTDAEKRRVAEWVDLNATYYGDYSTNYGTNEGGRSVLTDAERAAIGDGRYLGHNGIGVGQLSLSIYFDNPEKSPILAGKTGEAYDNALAIITAGRDRLRTNPDVDWKGLTTVPGNPSLSINPYKQNKMDAWRTEKVALVDAMEAANRAAIVAGTKLYDSDHEAVMAAHNAKWPGWPTATNTGNYYTDLPG